MKILTLLEKEERKKEDYNLYLAPAPGNNGPYITTAQAAKILGVNMSRVRQMIGDGLLKSHSPKKGQRDHLLKTSEVRALAKKERKKTGRPPES
jgi:excisionase family DNA binding protein